MTNHDMIDHDMTNHDMTDHDMTNHDMTDHEPRIARGKLYWLVFCVAIITGIGSVSVAIRKIFTRSHLYFLISMNNMSITCLW